MNEHESVAKPALTLLESLLETVVERVAARVLETLSSNQPSVPTNFEESVTGILQNADWFRKMVKEEVTQHTPVFDTAVKDVVGNMDLFDDREFDRAVDNRIDEFNMSDKVSEALDDVLEDKVKRILTNDISFDVNVS